MTLWTPNKPKPIHTQKINACVLVHRETKRILTFCFKDAFSKQFENQGFELIELTTAADYDRWAKKFRDQAYEDSEAEQYKKHCKEQPVRDRLRRELAERARVAPDLPSRAAAASALKCLDGIEDKKKRYLKESFMVQEGFEASATPGEEIINKAMKKQ